MPPLYSGSADEWSYMYTSNDTSNSDAKTVDFIIDNFEAEMKKGSHILKSNSFTVTTKGKAMLVFSSRMKML